MVTGCTSNLHTAHVDVATQSGALSQGYLVGGAGARILTMKKHVKSHVHALGPQAHTSLGGTADYGKDFRWKIARQGDYLLNNWIRVEGSAVTSTHLNNGLFLRWTHNLGHNLFKDIELTFSQVPGATFDEFYLDFFSAFSVPAGKRNMYDNMIGNLPELVNPIVDVATSTSAQVLPSFLLNVPLPMPYSRDIGVALPTGGLLYNEINVNVCLRDWNELLIVSNATNAAVGTLAANYSRQAVASDVVSVPTITSMQLWGNYVVVTSDERKRMGKVPRDMVWEIIQTASDTSIQSSTSSAMAYLRYTHAVKVLFFACRNNAVKSQLSNYTSRQPLCYSVTSGAASLTATEFPAPNAFDPISEVVLKYEGADRLNMPADFFSMIQPYFFAYSAPTVTGYHVFSYSSNFVNIDPAGSTDYGKLTNVSLEIVLGADAQAALGGAVIATGSLPFMNEQGVASALPPGYIALGLTTAVINGAGAFNAQRQTYELKNCALAHTVVRSIGGGLGFPIF